ncbi:MAG: divergent polysaccharide deacetylase family protein [Gluconacetobacter diazotrophicus]|nr:divergent polysaccharide deacetylase family protein [Gluconacetobacter diazotrophicus]
MRLAARLLVWFWAVVLLVLLFGAAALQLLGPPRRADHPLSRPATMSRPVLAAPGAVAKADPVLLVPAIDYPGRFLPAKAADGRTAATAYRSLVGLPGRTPRVAILLEGIGLAAEASRRAVEELPPPVSLAVSPYAADLARNPEPPLLDRARSRGHELWLSLPMQPAATTADEGDRALHRDGTADENGRALEWTLSRFTGYVGLTDAAGGGFGEGFADGAAFSLVADAVSKRGLLYAEGGDGSHDGSALPPPRSSRRADVVIDGRADAAAIAAGLTRLDGLATANGEAFAIAGPVSPLLVDQLRGWSDGIARHGISLVPVSALIPAQDPSSTPHPPAAPARAEKAAAP